VNATGREGSRSARPEGCSWRLMFAAVLVLVGCGGQGLHATTRSSGADESAAAGASGGGGSEDVGGVTALGGNAQGGGGVPIGAGGSAGGAKTSGVGGSSSGRGADASVAGGTGVASGGVTSQGDGASADQDGGVDDGVILDWSDAPCDLSRLWDAIKASTCGANPGFCQCFATPVGGDYVQFDSDGRIVVATGPRGVDGILADERWPCLAGQTVRYTCLFGE
jgi:hypothetical protein